MQTYMLLVGILHYFLWGITAEEAAEEKEEVMQMIKNVSSKFDSIKVHFQIFT